MQPTTEQYGGNDSRDKQASMEMIVLKSRIIRAWTASHRWRHSLAWSRQAVSSPPRTDSVCLDLVAVAPRGRSRAAPRNPAAEPDDAPHLVDRERSGVLRTLRDAAGRPGRSGGHGGTVRGPGAGHGAPDLLLQHGGAEGRARDRIVCRAASCGQVRTGRVRPHRRSRRGGVRPGDPRRRGRQRSAGRAPPRIDATGAVRRAFVPGAPSATAESGGSRVAQCPDVCVLGVAAPVALHGSRRRRCTKCGSAGNLHANSGDALRAAALEGMGIINEPDFLLDAGAAGRPSGTRCYRNTPAPAGTSGPSTPAAAIFR